MTRMPTNIHTAADHDNAAVTSPVPINDHNKPPKTDAAAVLEPNFINVADMSALPHEMATTVHHDNSITAPVPFNLPPEPVNHDNNTAIICSVPYNPSPEIEVITVLVPNPVNLAHLSAPPHDMKKCCVRGCPRFPYPP